MILTKARYAAALSIFYLLALAAEGQTLEYARQTVDTLCSPYMAGRGYVNEGDLKAAAYIAGEFQNLELERFHNSYFQNFDVAVNTFPGKMTVKIGNQELTPGASYIVDACSPGVSGTFEVFALKPSWLKDESLLQKKLAANAGKFLLVDERRLSTTLGETEELIGELWKSAPGLKGVLAVTEGKLIAAAAPVVCPFPAIYIKRDSLAHPAKLARGKLKARIEIEQKFEKAYQTQNVIGFIPGTVRRDSLIVFTAHYDHLGTMGAETYFPGANDNASGVAMMLSLAKHFAEKAPEYTVVFIAFGAEELYLSGSRYFVERPLFPLERISFLINIDLAGTGDDGVTVVNGSVFKDHFQKLDSINAANGLLPAVNARGATCNSDHCPFYRRGTPSFFIYTLGGIQAYHDIYDRAETLPLTRFEAYFRLLTLFSRCLMQP